MAYSLQSIETRNKNIPLSKSNYNEVVLEQKISFKTFDKLILLILVGLAVAVSGVLISKFVIISELNYTKQELQSSILNYKEENSILEMKIAELSTPDRIYEIATNNIGMSNAPTEKIKIVNSVRVAEVEPNYERTTKY